MRLLLDTHIVLGLVDNPGDFPVAISRVVRSPSSIMFASVASLWEIAIKVRLGKLPMNTHPSALPEALRQAEIGLIAIDHRHVLAELDPEPGTRDPFDRLLLAQCQVEGMRLVTLDRALVSHPLAWREEQAT